MTYYHVQGQLEEDVYHHIGNNDNGGFCYVQQQHIDEAERQGQQQDNHKAGMLRQAATH